MTRSSVTRHTIESYRHFNLGFLALVPMLFFSGALQAQSFTAVSAGDSHICGLLDTGEVDCSTKPFATRYDIPADAPLMTAIAAGQQHNCGITLDGAAYCWGAEFREDGTQINGNGFGELDIPAINAPLQSISAGINHTCALDTNGRAWCWGLNSNGQTDAPTDTFIKVDGAVNYSCGIRTSGNLICWTSDSRYQNTDRVGDIEFADLDLSRANACGLSTSGDIHCWEQLIQPPANGPYVDIAVTDGSICGLTPVGQLDCTFNFSNLSGVAAYEAAGYPVDLELASIESNADIFNFRSMCGVKTDGELACWGQGFTLDPPSVDGPGPDSGVSDIAPGLTATVYGPNSVELFWSPLPTNIANLQVEIYRDDVLIETRDARFSYFDPDPSDKQTSRYAIRVTDVFGNAGPFSNTIVVDRKLRTVENDSGIEPVNPRDDTLVQLENLTLIDHYNELTVLGWEVSNPTDQPITGYEVRRDGEIVGFTEAPVFVQREPRAEDCRLFSVAAIAPDGAILDYVTVARVYNFSSVFCSE